MFLGIWQLGLRFWVFGLRSLVFGPGLRFVDTQENSDGLLQGNLSLDPFTFLKNDNWVFPSTSTLHLYISSAHFKLHTGEEICWICLNFTALAFLGVHQRANGRWVIDQSERALYFRYVIKKHSCILAIRNACVNYRKKRFLFSGFAPRRESSIG